MDDQQNKKVMAVIGANGGIGSTLAHSLIASGHTVALGVQDAAQCDVEGGKAFALDATSWESVDVFFNDIETELGPVYGVALCVGSILLKPAHLTREHDFDQVINMNLKSAFAVVRSASKRMLKTGGSVVLVSSSAARRGIPPSLHCGNTPPLAAPWREDYFSSTEPISPQSPYPRSSQCAY
jgi:3-oxoacyl-[acyl-carrier protein] reductase